jgi:hypothetical protein
VLLCFLGGCSFEPTGLGPGDGPPGELTPSSGARVEHLDGVTASLVVPTSRVIGLDTDTGEITLFEDPLAGAVGLGDRARHGVLPADVQLRSPGPQVINGMGFYVVSDKVSVLSVSSLTIESDAALYPYGTHSIVLLSAGDVSIRGILDVSAPCDGTTGTCAGPGGGDGAENQDDVAEGCAPGKNGNGSISTVARTGGGGGAFGTDGAPGGTAGAGVQAGGQGGVLVDNDDCPGSSLVPLVGGSGGGAGAYLGEGGNGGGGGGAVQITSLTRIDVDPPNSNFFQGIFASGAGGGGGSDGGGGGGGAGGAIVLEAPVIKIVRAYLIANGGAGGGGGQAGVSSSDGEDGQPNGEVAIGGTGTAAGGTGGVADALPKIGLGGGNSTGGGGGSVGIIRLHAPAAQLQIEGATVSPPPIEAEPSWATAADIAGGH